MDASQLQEVCERFELARRAEESLAELYRACAAAWPDSRGFWSDLSADETRHAEMVGRLRDLVCRSPDRFDLGRMPDTVLFRAFVAYIGRQAGRVAAGAVAPGDVLQELADIEQSVVDYSFPDFVRTDDPEYRRLAEVFSRETAAHRSSLARRAARAASGGMS